MVKKTRFGFNKLTRDFVKKNFDEAGAPIKCEKLTGDALLKALKEKLLEEAQEVLDAKNQSELIEELADVQEVMQVLIKKASISTQEIADVQEKKRNKKGSFENGLFIYYGDIPVGNYWHEYCMKDPHKYPIIKEIDESDAE